MDINIAAINEYIIECIKDNDYNDDSNAKLIKFYIKQNKLNIPDNIQNIIRKSEKQPIIINMKNYIIENKKNGDKLLIKK